MKTSFSCRISILIAFAVLVTSISLNLFFKNYYTNDEMKHIEERITDIAQLSGMLIAADVQRNDIATAHRKINEIILRFKDLRSIIIYDINGHVIDSHTEDTRQRSSDLLVQKAIESRHELRQWSGYRLHHIGPLKYGNGITGFLHIESDAGFLQSYLAKRVRFFIAVTCILSLLLITVGVITSRSLIRPLKEISEASRKIADGDLSASVSVKSNDEFGLLALNFNLMVDKLNIASKEVDNYTKNLEYVIEARTERLNRTLKEFKQQKDFMDMLVSTVGALIVVLDVNGRIVMFNKTCEDLTGYKEEEVKETFLWDQLVPERALPALRIVFDELVEQKAPISIKNPWLTKEGLEKTILWNNTVVTDESEIKYVIATGIDVTEKEQLEAHLWESQRLRSIATLVSGLSHNFNNILVGVLGYAGLLRLKLGTVEHKDVREIIGLVDIIENSANKAADLIKNLRMFSKKTNYKTTSIDINETVKDVLNIITPSFPRIFTIETNLQEGLEMINADSDQLQQALLNICLNGKEAMPEGGKLKIETFSEEITKSERPLQRSGKLIAVRISDTGGGITADVQSRVYEPFFTTKNPLEHIGLGLSLVYNTIKDHNGYIVLNSKPGKGTSFTVYIPVASTS